MMTALYLGALVASALAGFRLSDTKPKRFPILTLVLCLCLAVCLALQYLYPALLPLLERDTVAIQGGQWWRIGTALFFQDGWFTGGLSNIFFLALIGSLAEQLWKRQWWLTLYFGSGLLAECVALAWQPVGAGNSIAVFGLAASICMYALVTKTKVAPRVFAAIGTVCAVALAFTHDIHGAAFMLGCVISAGLFVLIKMVE